MFPGQIARLILPPIEGGNTAEPFVCLKFVYCAYGSDVGVLSVTDEQGRRYWTLPLDVDYSKSLDWLEAAVTLPKNVSTFGFEALRGGVNTINDKGDIAIDDVEIVDGGCPGS